MSVFQRMSSVFQQKVNAALDRTEDPQQALDFSYEKQLEALQQVRRNVADVLTSEKRLELQAAQLKQNQSKLQGQAQAALQQGREDLARLALTRSQEAQAQLAGLGQQIDQMKEQEQKLELMAQKLQAKVEAFRTQKETIKAQYSAAQASTKIGEAVTGISEQMADVNLTVERAQNKTTQMQARAAAIDDLVASGTLDQIGAGSTDDIDRQLASGTTKITVDSQLAEMKRQLAAGTTAPQLTTGAAVVRIQGDDQYRLQRADRDQLDRFDADLVTAITAGDEPSFRAKLRQVLEFVKTRGERLSATQLEPSDVVLPSEDMTLPEAKEILADVPASAGQKT
jgi:phage shock protein A